MTDIVDLLRGDECLCWEAATEIEMLRKQIKAQDNEIERLRNALRRVAEKCPATPEITLAHEMADAAIAALEGKS